MNIFAFILLLAGGILFLVSAFRTRPVSLVDLGLAALDFGLLVEFCAKTHTIHF